MNHFPAIAVFALLLSACFSDDENSRPISDQPSTNQKPVVSGNPPPSIAAGQEYDFTPSASDPDGDTLRFHVANKPSWTNFDARTGRLWGTPQAADVGINLNIAISVTDGSSITRLPQFAVSVEQIASGSVTLSWYPPTQNADGTTLTDLAGYRIYYGPGADSLNQIITLGNPGLTMLVIEQLRPATWHFSMASFNAKGIESERSPTVSKTVG